MSIRGEAAEALGITISQAGTTGAPPPSGISTAAGRENSGAIPSGNREGQQKKSKKISEVEGSMSGDATGKQ